MLILMMVPVVIISGIPIKIQSTKNNVVIVTALSISDQGANSECC